MSTTSIRGGLGPQGFRGPKGDQGLQGPTGQQGPTGAQGLNGAQGIQGPTGLQGKGFVVYKSGDGYPVSADFIGHDGEFYLKKGGDMYCYLPGTTGSQVDLQDFKYVGDVTDESVLQGPKGDTGSQGPTGLKGDQGIQGFTGEKGEQGIQGLIGPAEDSTGVDPSLLNSKANLESPTFTGTVSGITSEMVTTNNIIINSIDLDSSGNFILNTNNFKDGSSIINTSIISSPLIGNGLSGASFAICADLDPSSNDIYIGGGFSAYNTGTTIVPGTNNICKYNTETGLYSAVGNGLNGAVRTICAIPNSDGTSRDIYIGGTFTIATNSDNSTVDVNRICIYNTSSKRYTTVGNGLSGNCFAICADTSSNDIYIGGQFTSAYNTGTTTVSGTNNICIYNTSSKVYRKVGNGLENVSYALCVVPNLNGSRDIYIGGQFTSATNSDNSTVTGTSKICKYNTGSESYSALGKGLDNLTTSNYCYSICADPSSNDIYIGGQFTSATNSDNSTVTVNNICKYNTGNNSYYAVGNGLNGVCNAIRAVPNLNGSRDIYIGGQFTSAYNTVTTGVPGTKYICKYNTGTCLYSAVGNGLNSSCYVLCAVPNSTDMYIGGGFGTIIDSNNYSLPVFRICKINSSINIYNYNINIYYKNTLISSINPINTFEVIQKNTINSKEYITLVVGSNKKFII